MSGMSGGASSKRSVDSAYHRHSVGRVDSADVFGDVPGYDDGGAGGMQPSPMLSPDAAGDIGGDAGGGVIEMEEKDDEKEDDRAAGAGD